MPGSSELVKVAFSVSVEEEEEEGLALGVGVISETEETEEMEFRWDPVPDEGARGGPPPAEALRSRPLIEDVRPLWSMEFLLAPVWIASNDPLLAMVAATAAC